MLKQIKKTTLTLLALALGLAILFTSVLVLSFAVLPDEKINKNAQLSIDSILEDNQQQYGVKDSFLEKIRNVYVTRVSNPGGINFRSFSLADLLMLSFSKGDSLFQYTIDDPAFYDWLIEQNYVDFGEGKDVTNVTKAMTPSYARYWNGYMVILRPLLLLGDIATIRYINGVLLMLCFAVICALLAKRFGTGFAALFAVCLAVVQGFMIPYCMEYTVMFLLSGVISIVLLLAYPKLEQKQWGIYFFFIAGALTAYFDLLSTPLLSLLLPLTFYILMRLKEPKTTWRSNVLLMLSSVFGWGLGYTGLWAAKWAIGSQILQENIFANALISIKMRSGVFSSRLTGIGLNMMYFGKGTSSLVFLGIAIVLVAALIIWVLHKQKKTKTEVLTALPLLAIVAAPFIFFFFGAEFSSVHHFMTHRLFFAGLFAYGCFFIFLLSKNFAKTEEPPAPDKVAAGNPYKTSRKKNARKRGIL
ncbi:MAG: hypothetical protein LBT21_05815 [Oscillospiraceae bacterium]|jgi:hypothetical protein|nr:hypothetical protein [Oscillospiraceae bacterium]